MSKTAISLLTATALVTAVAACGGEPSGSGTDAGGERGQAADRATRVPEGVAAQYATVEEEVRAEGGETSSGPWRIAYIVEPAEGWFEGRGDAFEWREPAEDETHHIEILPIEASTGRLVPGVPVTLEVSDDRGRRVARQALSPYYAEFFHYADNFSIPEAGDYTLKATIEPPVLRRHGEEAEAPVLDEGAEVEFKQVRLEPEAG